MDFESIEKLSDKEISNIYQDRILDFTWGIAGCYCTGAITASYYYCPGAGSIEPGFCHPSSMTGQACYNEASCNNQCSRLGLPFSKCNTSTFCVGSPQSCK